MASLSESVARLRGGAWREKGAGKSGLKAAGAKKGRVAGEKGSTRGQEAAAGGGGALETNGNGMGKNGKQNGEGSTARGRGRVQMVYQRRCVVTSGGAKFCFAAAVAAAGDAPQEGAKFFISRTVVDSGVKGGLFPGDVVLINARVDPDAATGKRHPATRVTLVLRNNTKYLEQQADGADLEAPDERRGHTCRITCAGHKFAMAEDSIFISHELQESCRVNGG